MAPNIHQQLIIAEMNELENPHLPTLWVKYNPSTFLDSQRSKREFDQAKMVSPGENGTQHVIDP
jgi:hypothetical protein